MAIISVGHRPELEAFHERKVTLIRREGGAQLEAAEITAPPISPLGLMLPGRRKPTDEPPAIAAE